MPTPTYNQAKNLYASNLLRAYINGEEILSPSTAELQEPDLQKIFTDPVAAHAFHYYKTQIAGVDEEIVAASTDKEDVQLRGCFEEILGEMENKVQTRADLSEVRLWGKTFAFARFGFRWVRIPGKKKSEYLSCPYEIKHVSKNRIREFYNKLDGNTYYKVFSLSDLDWVPLDPRAVIRITESGAEHHFGGGGGIADALYWAVTQKRKIEKEGIRLAERIGQGFMSLTLREKDMKGGKAGDLAKINDAYKQMFERMKARHVAMLREGDRVEFHEPGGTGWEVLRFFLSYYDSIIRILLVGSTLPIDAGDTSNSFALAKIQENSSWTNAQYGRYLINEAYSTQLFPMIFRANVDYFKRENLYYAKLPRYLIKEGRRNDPFANASQLSTLWGLGIPFVESEVYERTGWTQPSTTDKTLSSKEFEISGSPPSGGMSKPAVPFDQFDRFSSAN